MEKFSNWRDGPTGIHPLLPPKIKSSNIIITSVSFIFGIVLFITRLPFIIVLSLLLVGSDVLFKSLPLGMMSRILNRFFAIIFGRLLLISMGFIRLDQYTESLSKSQSMSGSLSGVKLNDIILSNHTSYVDIIYMAYRYSPTFAVPPNDVRSSSGVLVTMTLWQAIMQSINCPVVTSSRSQKIGDIMTQLKWHGPLVVFVEGATGNGSGLLDVSSVVVDGWSTFNIGGLHVIGIHYPQVYPVYTSVGSIILHFIRLASRVSNTIEAMYLSRTNISTDKSGGIPDWYNSLMNNLAALVHARRTRISSHDKLSFVAYWYGYKVNYSDKKKD